jgi:hypothetical protein
MSEPQPEQHPKSEPHISDVRFSEQKHLAELADEDEGYPMNGPCC